MAEKKIKRSKSDIALEYASELVGPSVTGQGRRLARRLMLQEIERKKKMRKKLEDLGVEYISEKQGSTIMKKKKK